MHCRLSLPPNVRSLETEQTSSFEQLTVSGGSASQGHFGSLMAIYSRGVQPYSSTGTLETGQVQVAPSPGSSRLDVMQRWPCPPPYLRQPAAEQYCTSLH